MAAAAVRRGLMRVGFVALVLGLGWFLLAFVLVSSAASSAQGRVATGDAIVILGAAQYNGLPSPVLERRLDAALDLWMAEAAPRIVTTGSNQPGDNFTEGFAAFRYLRNAGIAEDQIVVIIDGGDTYESLLATVNQLDTDKRSVVLVTDAYHARRSEDIANEVGLDATVVAAGSDTALGRRLRESVAVAIGRVVSYRRLSDWR
jgi:vancomycin permeability regulator SanA